MSRPPEPRRLKGRPYWYAVVHGKRVRLTDHPRDGIAKAWERLAILTAAPGSGPVPTVGALCLAMLEALDSRVERNDLGIDRRRALRSRLRRWCEHEIDGRAVGDLPADQVRPYHVTTWLDAHPAWNGTTRRDYGEDCRQVFRWAVREGRLDRDPLAAMPKQGRRQRRERIPSPEELDRIEAAIVQPGLRDLVRLLRLTGARPGEIARVEARHVRGAAIVYSPAEHKTGRKTGTTRTIHLPPEAVAIVARLVVEHPEGPLIRTRLGTPYRPAALSAVFRRAAQAARVDATIYAIRHAFTIEGIRRGVDSSELGQILGHRSSRIVDQVYGHWDRQQERLQATVRRITAGSASPEPPPSGPGEPFDDPPASV